MTKMSKIIRRSTSVLATAATAGVLALIGAGAAQAAGANYVALGDSYSSGVGTGDYYSNSGSCDRSPEGYPVLWSNANAPSSFNFAACSGATTSDVLSSQVSSLSASTSLVSITIGGNDVGFASDMQTCVLSSTSSCVSAIDNSETQAKSILPGRLDNVLNTIRSKSPNARIVVLGYPEFYDLSKSSGCIGLSTTDRQAINGGADLLDSLLQQAAARHSDVWADVRSAFSGHEICDGTSWLNSVDWFSISNSYHPTASGYSGAYYPVFRSAA